MALYQVHVFCNVCAYTHPLGLSLSLDDGPPEKESIGNLYAGKDLPPQIAQLLDNRTVCPNTGKWFTQKDNNQVFLVAIAD